jgi:glycine cleavage system transcriptional repressor
MPNFFVISVMAEDRTGIVADVTTAIRDLGGNLADMSQTVLRGHFTMILIASFPESVGPDDIRAALEAVQGPTPFAVGLRACPGEPPAEQAVIDDRQYVLTAVGPDRTGLVSAVAEYLRQKGINIRDLSTCVEQGVYTMILLLELPQGTDVARLKRSLQIAMEDVALNVEIRHHALFRSTNEI